MGVQNEVDESENQRYDNAPNASSALLEGLQSETEEAKSESEMLHRMSIGKLKWGVVTTTQGMLEAPGHLAFGTEHQAPRPPADDEWYA